jgi:UDP-glucose 4-epimerase
MTEFDFGGAKVLVVGGAGFVGSNLVRLLLQSNVGQIIIVDNLLSSDMVNVPLDDRVTMIPRSITEDAVLASLPGDLDYAFALYCLHGNQSSIADPLLDHDNNTLPSLKLFDRLKNIKSLKKVVYAAAGCAVAEKTFGEAAATKEDAPISAYHDSPYSISKLIGEFYGNYYFRQHGLPFVKARFQNVYGPWEILGAGDYRGTVHTVWRNVTPTFIFRALHHDQLRLDNGGDASRDFIFVEDMARGLASCALRGEAGEVYNLASGVETTILELAQKVNALAGNQTPYDLAPKRDWDTSGKRFGDPSKAREKLGFEAKVGIDEGLGRTVAWTRENLNLIKRCMAKHQKFVPEVAKYLDA